jgi:hypothetical protein
MQIKSISFRINRRICRYIQLLLDVVFDTHSKYVFTNNYIWFFADITKLEVDGIDINYVRELLRMWMGHRFDLLGSGWVRCGFLDNAPGVEGCRYSALSFEADAEGQWFHKILAKKNIQAAKTIWSQIPIGYHPIDWQKDFKSGYRWDAKTSYLFQKWAEKPGGDIKVPWELARLQHLPRMAIFAQLFPEDKGKIAGEFRNQCLDFIAQNPPRMGVNWKCTMDVGIRTANMVLAYSLFCTGGYIFDKSFNQIFLRSVYEHCWHIRTNLEWSEYLNANHYLANIAGLLFGSALLPPSIKQKSWLKFACEEIKNEIAKQFYVEGSNFEGSTAYHRLSSDMSVYAVALISAIKGKETGREIANKIFGMAKFLEAVTRPDQVFSQIGDNDSGLFFRLSPTGVLFHAEDAIKKYRSLSGYCPEKEGESYPDENLNDGRPTISAISGLFKKDSFFEYRQQYPLEYSMVRMLCNGFIVQSKWEPPNALIDSMVSLPELVYHQEIKLPSGEIALLPGLQRIDFPAFGIYVFRSDTLYLLVNAADNGQNGRGGHAHNDKLSFELLINGNLLYEDPGCYAYTPFPELRNKYRSVNVHNTIHTGVEQNEFFDLFSIKNQSKCTLVNISDKSICLLAEYQGICHRREFRIENKQILIIDDCNKPFNTLMDHYSDTAGYGKIKNK